MKDDILIPTHPGCFVCDTNMPNSMGVQWIGKPDGQTIYGTTTLTTAFQGPPGHAHGGASASLLDDAMGVCAWYAGNMCMTGKMTVNYRRPVPLGVELLLTARVTGKEGRKIFVEAQLALPDETIAVDSQGLFVQIPDMFKGDAHFEAMRAFANEVAFGRNNSSVNDN